LVPGTRVTAQRLQLVPVRQAAGTLGLSTATVYGLVSRNELAAVRIGGAVRIAVTDLDRFIKGRRHQSPVCP
jgi:excisionase family DNA binding protein